MVPQGNLTIMASERVTKLQSLEHDVVALRVVRAANLSEERQQACVGAWPRRRDVGSRQLDVQRFQSVRQLGAIAMCREMLNGVV